MKKKYPMKMNKFQTVRRNPGHYKICNICMNFNLVTYTECWFCHTVDFDFSEDRILAKVTIEEKRLQYLPDFERHNYIRIG